jgi:large subunit ribosomal protein L10
MNKQEKNNLIDILADQLGNNGIVYLADTSELTVGATNDLRRECFKNNVTLAVVKNSLLRKAMERTETKNYGELVDVLKGPTSIMFSETGNAPAKVIQKFRKKHQKPLLKGAWIEEGIYIGDDQLQALVDIKSKEELIGEIIGLLQSPAKNVISALKSPAGKLAGILKTLEERTEA